MFLKRFVTGLAFTALLVPQLSLAATPQQMLDRGASLSLQQNHAQANTFDFTVALNFRPVAKGETAHSVKVHVIATLANFPRIGTLPDTEQTIRVESVNITGAPELGMAFPLKDPVSFELKKIGNVYYMRIASISDQVRELINGMHMTGLNLDQLVGTWLQIDIDQLGQALQQVLPSTDGVNFTSQSQMDLSTQLLSLVQKPGVLRALRLESRTNRNGVMYDRVQFQINPVFWTNLETLLKKNIEKNLASLKVSDRKSYNLEYASQTKDLRASLLAVRTQIARVKMIAVINESTGMIERIEAAGKSTQPSYTETYVGTRIVKRLAGYNDISFSLVSGMKSLADRSLIAPTNFVSLESLVQRVQEQMQASLGTTQFAE